MRTLFEGFGNQFSHRPYSGCPEPARPGQPFQTFRLVPQTGRRRRTAGEEIHQSPPWGRPPWIVGTNESTTQPRGPKPGLQFDLALFGHNARRFTGCGSSERAASAAMPPRGSKLKYGSRLAAHYCR